MVAFDVEGFDWGRGFWVGMGAKWSLCISLLEYSRSGNIFFYDKLGIVFEMLSAPVVECGFGDAGQLVNQGHVEVMDIEELEGILFLFGRVSF